MTIPQPEAIAFERSAALSDWLMKHHEVSSELWVRIYKAGSGQPSITWTDCVVEAIRFGWIDGLKRSGDDGFYLQRLTPRRAGSNWSAKNRDHADRLIAEGRMTPAGLAHVQAARADGRWGAAYEGSAAMAIPQDFLDALAAMPQHSSIRSTARTCTRSTIACRRPRGRKRAHAGCSKFSTSSSVANASTEPFFGVCRLSRPVPRWIGIAEIGALIARRCHRQKTPQSVGTSRPLRYACCMRNLTPQ